MLKNLKAFLVFTLLSFSTHVYTQDVALEDLILLSIKKDAERGNIDSQNTLGYMYLNGSGVVKDNKEAIYWFSKAAEQNSSRAQFELANLYMEDNISKAVYYLEEASNNNNINAQAKLAFMYFYGDKVDKDYEKALFYAYKAGINDDIYSLCILATIYKDGLYGEQDLNQAHYFALRAFEHNYKYAKEILDEIESKSKFTESKRTSSFNSFILIALALLALLVAIFFILKRKKKVILDEQKDLQDKKEDALKLAFKSNQDREDSILVKTSYLNKESRHNYEESVSLYAKLATYSYLRSEYSSYACTYDNALIKTKELKIIKQGSNRLFLLAD